MQLNFEELQSRFLQLLRERVQNGELTERGLARLAGISQPHVHNVLKGVRNLSSELRDAICKVLDFSILDLCSAAELKEHLDRLRAVEPPTLELAFLCSAIGPGQPWPAGINGQDRHAVPATAAKLGKTLVLARLSPDRDMAFGAKGKNFAILDISEIGMYSPDNLYVVDRGRDAVLRCVRPGLAKAYLVADGNADRPERWEPIPAPMGIAALLRARVCEFGYERKGAKIAAT